MPLLSVEIREKPCENPVFQMQSYRSSEDRLGPDLPILGIVRAMASGASQLVF